MKLPSLKDGLRVEAACTVVARHGVRQFFDTFGFAVRTDRLAGQGTVAAYIDALAGAMALTVAGGHDSKEEIVNATVLKLREAVERDLQHLKRTI